MKPKIVSRICFGSILLLLGVVFILPFWSMLITSFSARELSPGRLVFLPRDFSLRQYRTVWFDAKIYTYIRNSFIVVVFALALQVCVSVMAAFPLARREFKGKKIVLVMFLATMMVSEEVISIPLYLVLSDIPLLGINLLNSYAGMVLPLGAWMFSIVLLAGYMKGIPRELEECARMDGGGDFLILRKILVPLSLPALGSITIFGFIMIWDQYLLPLIVSFEKSLHTLPVALITLAGDDYTIAASVMAAAALSILPSVVIYFLLQRFFAAGLSAGSLKG